MHTQKVVLITGANRGIGLGLTEAFLANEEIVIATARNPEKADALQDLKQKYKEQLTVYEFDALNPHAASHLAEQVGESFGRVDWLINNAAIYRHAVLEPHDDECSDFGNYTHEALTQMMTVNCVAPIMMAQEFYPLIEKSQDAKVVNISSEMGSIERNDYHNQMGYCVSKAALNMATHKLSYVFEADKFPVVCVSPGWVRTQMGGPNADLSIDESVESLVKFINDLNFDQNGGFFRRDGSSLPW